LNDFTVDKFLVQTLARNRIWPATDSDVPLLEEGTSVTNDVVKVQSQDPGTSCRLRSVKMKNNPGPKIFLKLEYQVNKTKEMATQTTTTLFPAPVLPKTSARPSDARPATSASRFTGVLLCCALCLHVSRTLVEPHGVRRRRQYNHAARCSGAPRQLQLRALDLLLSPC